ILVFLGGCLFAVTSFAQNARSFVSTSGNDTNVCTLASQCRTFGRAVTQTNAGGEIIALDSGGFGQSFTIDRALTISAAPGVTATVSGTTLHVITVNTGSADRVVLRNITVVASNTISGIIVYAVGDLHIEHCTILGSNTGVWAISGGLTTITDSEVLGPVQIGFNLRMPGVIMHSRVLHSGNYGFEIAAAATLIDIDAEYCGGTGIDVNNSTTTAFAVTCESCTSSHNNYGVGVVGSGAPVTFRMNNCKANDNVVVGVGTGNLGVAASMGNNMIEGNGLQDVYGTITPLTKY
ncbi:MAG TPA: right-handed parallel beta-helix repeat-containing protein, partial [Thermoanaerobaculia bacterium]